MIVRKKPEEVGISSDSFLTLLHTIDESDMELHSLQVIRHGACVLDCSWTPYASHIPHAMFSLTKTLTALAVGFAIDEGKLSLDDKLVSFFPEYVDDDMDDRMRKVCIRDLLTMRAGYFENLSGCGHLSLLKDNLAKRFLSLPLTYEPGEKFVYNSGSTHMLSCILSKVTGKPEQMYLAEKLFEPLSIGPVLWDTDLCGNSTGAWGAYLTADQMAKIGQFMLQRGVWEDKRLLSDRWFDQMSHPHVRVEENKPGYFYGFQVWIPGDNSYQADGAFGQVIYVIPDYDCVLVMTRGIPNLKRDPMIGNSLDRGWIYRCVLEHAADTELPQNPEAYHKLCEAVKRESLPEKPYGQEPDFCRNQRLYYHMNWNAEGIEGIELEFWNNEVFFAIYDVQGYHRVSCGKGKWLSSHADMPGKELHHNRYFEAMSVGAQAAWIAEGVLEISLAFLNLQSVDRIICEITEKKIIYKRSVRFNADGLPTQKETLCGNRRRF